MAKTKTPKDPARPDSPHAPVIDLVAEPVIEPEPAPEPPADPVVEPKAPPPPPPPPRPQQRKANNSLYWTAALALLAALAGAWLYRAYGESLWPSDRTLAVEAKLSALEAGQGTLNAQLKEIGATVDSTLARETELKALAQRSGSDAAAARTAIDATSARLAALETELSQLKTNISALQAAPPSTGGAIPALDLGALKVLEGRVDALEKALAALSAVKRGPDADTVATLSQALSDLKAKFALGAPYGAELGTITGLVPAAPGLDVLVQSAEKGIASPEQLAAKLRSLAEALPAAGAAPPAAEDEGGFWNSVGEFFGSVVTVKTIGETDWRDLALKAADAAASGDLRLAVERLTAPGGDMPAALAAWIAEAKARSDATAALSSADQAVLRHIASIGQPK